MVLARRTTIFVGSGSKNGLIWLRIRVHFNAFLRLQIGLAGLTRELERVLVTIRSVNRRPSTNTASNYSSHNSCGTESRV